MALYKYSQFIGPNSNEAFDQLNRPGSTTPYSGIYCCENCGHEIASNRGNPLPPQNHHQHDRTQGAIQWRLTVATGS